jgi:hypothetical protein
VSERQSADIDPHAARVISLRAVQHPRLRALDAVLSLRL